MRQLKFRMWRDGRMQQLHSLRTSEEYTFDFQRAETESLDHHGEPGGGIIMQFTGLKDRNGVEIYEGDILQMDGRYTYTVQYEEAKFVAYHLKGNSTERNKWGNLHRFFDPDYSDYVVVVIGNIYSNPELLTP